MNDWLGDAASALTAIFTGGTLAIAYLAYRGQQTASKPACFVDFVPYENAVGLDVTVRNRADHPMRVVRLTVSPKRVQLAAWRSMSNNFIDAVSPASQTVSVDEVLSSTRQGGDSSKVFDGILVGDGALPRKLSIRVEYDPLGDGRTKTITRSVPIPPNLRAPPTSNEKPATIEE